jgi:hypothetical protein
MIHISRRYIYSVQILRPQFKKIFSRKKKQISFELLLGAINTIKINEIQNAIPVADT